MHRAAALFAAVSVVAACTHETISPELGVCRLSPSVSVDASVKAPDGSVVDGSALGFAPRASELSFKVAALSGDFEGEWASVDDYPSTRAFVLVHTVCRHIMATSRRKASESRVSERGKI